MTKQRTYEGGTAFSLWLRAQPELDSQLSYHCYDIDFVWMNMKSGLWLLIEEKRFGKSAIKAAPHIIFGKINKLCAKDPDYRGFHFLCFENSGPDDGKIQLNYKDISKEDLLKFLQFDQAIIDRYRKDDSISQKFPEKIVEYLPKLK